MGLWKGTGVNDLVSSNVFQCLSAHLVALYNSALRLLIVVGQSGVQFKEQSPEADSKLRARLPCMTLAPISNQSYL